MTYTRSSLTEQHFSNLAVLAMNYGERERETEGVSVNDTVMLLYRVTREAVSGLAFGGLKTISYL